MGDNIWFLIRFIFINFGFFLESIVDRMWRMVFFGVGDFGEVVFFLFIDVKN